MTRDLTGLLPFDLTWAEADPRLHPFDSADALEAVLSLAPASRVPTRPVGHAADHAVISWSHNEGADWADDMTRALVERFGRWTTGWRWAHDEGDLGGGPVGSWCCTRDSMTTPEETLTRVTDALCEWREWLEILAERFDRHRLDTVRPEDRPWAWERAATHLINHCVDRTGGGDAWYSHCSQVLTWFLTRWGVDEQTARARVAHAIDGRFESWIGPDQRLVTDVAERLAASLDSGGNP